MVKPKILIIDDEQINLDFFNVMLSRLGFDISTASNGEEGLDQLLEFNPDLLILDIMMPGISGWAVVEKIRYDEDYINYKDLPIIMFSAMDSSDEKIKGFELGIDDYITKPFNFSDVYARIRAVLKHRELIKQNFNQEKHIMLIDSLSNSLEYFADHLNKPVMELLEQAKKIDIENKQIVVQFKEKVIEECEKALAAMNAMADKLDEIRESKDLIKDTKELIDEMDKKFEIHYRNLRENQK